MFTHLDALPYAIKASLESPCMSRRGVVIFDPYLLRIYGTGFNRPPAPFVCDGSDFCKDTCAKTAIHAEQMAILQVFRLGWLVSGKSLLHVKTVDGLPVAS